MCSGNLWYDIRMMKKVMVLVLLFSILLSACATPPQADYQYDPEAAVLYAGATQTASARMIVQTGEAQAVVIRATEAAQATQARQQQAIATGTAQAGMATQAARATGTAVFQATAAHATAEMQSAEVRVYIERENARSTATAQAMALQARIDEQKAERARWWSYIWMAFTVGLLAAVLGFLFALAFRIKQQAKVVRNRNDGKVVALLAVDGDWEYVDEPAVQTAPAPQISEDLDYREVPVNGEPIQLRRPAKIVEYAGDSYSFSGHQLDRMEMQVEQGDLSIRRESSTAGPGWDKIGIGGGETYNRVLAILKGRGYAETHGNGHRWTALGLLEVLGLDRPPAPQTNGHQPAVTSRR